MMKNPLKNLFLCFNALCLGISALALTVPDAIAFGLRQWPVVKAAPTQDGAIKLHSFESDPVNRTVFAMAYEHGEYARFKQGDMVAEVAYDTAIDEGDEISLVYEHTVERMIEGWNFNRGKAISYGVRSAVKNDWDDIAYTAYQLAGSHACVGFLYEWDHPPADPKSYPGKIAFGYMCKQQSQPLTQSQIAEFIGGLDVAQLEAAGASLPSNGAASTDAKALAMAQGGEGFGHPEFPFDYGFPYDNDDGGDNNN
ncbi:MAG: hypothetical protein O2912_10040 [Proteobacteria bacterium]|nr:hypothetical protein [Pseudomonadota bacterium]